jgi:formylglycine-generating enzyme required for sulfatase activity
MPRSGNFADVYELRCPDGGRWAVKCFTREVPGLSERYQEISRHLAQARLPFAVDFHYLEQGIRVAGRCYPVLKMDWVEGLLLNDFVRQYLDRPAMLEALADLWVRLARRLRRAGVAHGDLQHGNVLLVPGRDEQHLALRLIDYDGMFVPALSGAPSGEVGHPAYQHPQRLRESTYNADVDRFPLLVIYCAIRALIVGGRPLWDRYDNGDNLLFREQDLRSPRDSALFRELVRLDAPDVKQLADQLSRAVYKPLDQAPLLEDLIAPRQPAAAPASAIAEVAAPGADLTPTSTAMEGSQPRQQLWENPRVRLLVASVAAVLVPAVLGLVVLLALSANSAAPTNGSLVAKASGPAVGPERRSPGREVVPELRQPDPEPERRPEYTLEPPKPDLPKPELPQPKEPAPEPPKLTSEDPPKAPTPTPTGTTPDKPKPTGPSQEPRPPDEPVLPNSFKNNLGMEFVRVPKGKSWLGGGAGKPGTKEVNIPHDFYLGQYLVTQEEWQNVMGANPSYFSRAGKGKDAVQSVPDEDLKRFPVENVSWDDSLVFLAEVNKRAKETGWVYRLPTEMEWEYACRGGPLADMRDSGFDYYFDKPTGQLLLGQANTDNGKGRTSKVGSYPPNQLGLYDMHGNVWEWCGDTVVDKQNLLHQEKGDSQRVERAGCWHDEARGPYCRASSRISFPASYRNNDHGLRLARVPVGMANK